MMGLVDYATYDDMSRAIRKLDDTEVRKGWRDGDEERDSWERGWQWCSTVAASRAQGQRAEQSQHQDASCIYVCAQCGGSSSAAAAAAAESLCTGRPSICPGSTSSLAQCDHHAAHSFAFLHFFGCSLPLLLWVPVMPGGHATRDHQACCQRGARKAVWANMSRT